MSFYSYDRVDEWIANNLPLPERGVYVDVGAAEPKWTSNTAFLRDRGWTGVGIDGNPNYARLWTTPFVCAVIAKDPEVRFSIEDNAQVSRIRPEGKCVRSMPLSMILENEGITKIDFLSVDIEGAEFDAFQTFDWEKIRPTIIVSEYSTEGLGEDFRVRDMLLGSGLYEVVHRTTPNLVFALKC